jgi:hypothetical protein
VNRVRCRSRVKLTGEFALESEVPRLAKPSRGRDFLKLLRLSPNPTKLAERRAVSESGEPGSRGHLNVQVACRPRPHGTSP